MIAQAETEDYSASCDFAYDLADKKILTGPGEDVEMYGTLPDGTAYYTVHSEDGTVHICLGTDLQPVTDADGKEYSYCLVQNDIAYLAWSDGTNYYADPYDAKSARTDSDGRITMNISGYSDDAADNMSLAAKGIFVSGLRLLIRPGELLRRVLQQPLHLPDGKRREAYGLPVRYRPHRCHAASHHRK